MDAVDEAWVDAAIARMSLEQKVGQMFQIDWRILRPPASSSALKSAAHAIVKVVVPPLASLAFFHDENRPLSEDAVEPLRIHMLGSVLGGGGAAPSPNTPLYWREQNDTMQRAAARTPSSLPLLIGNDSVHGQNNLQNATLFPHHIALGCMRTSDGKLDTALVEKLSAMAAKESFACGVNWMFTPCVAVPQDLRWGRTYEGMSEDTATVAALGAAVVRGIQNQSFPMAACLKHWAGDGGTQYGTGTDGFAWAGGPGHILDQGDTRIDEKEMREKHIAAYLPALEAGCLTVMASYSSWNGKKCHSSAHLLTSVLKQELGFRGLVVSDYNAIQQCGENYRVAVASCINAGVDMIMTAAGMFGDLGLEEQIREVLGAVRNGEISIARIDDAVRRIIRVKAALGLVAESNSGAFPAGSTPARSSVSAEEMASSVGCAAHRELAREAVRKSMVLLKNSGSTLPLPIDTPLVVGGQGANDMGMQCGGWSMEWLGFRGNEATKGTTIWQALSSVCSLAQLADDNLVPMKSGKFAKQIKSDGEQHLDPATTVLLVLGETPYAEGAGDTKEACLSKADADMIATAANGKRKVVVVLICGRPLVIAPETLEKIDALLVAWLPGTEGAGVSDALFGFSTINGKLSFSWPRDVTQPHRSQREGDKALFAREFGLDLTASRATDQA